MTNVSHFQSRRNKLKTTDCIWTYLRADPAWPEPDPPFASTMSETATPFVVRSWTLLDLKSKIIFLIKHIVLSRLLDCEESSFICFIKWYSTCVKIDHSLYLIEIPRCPAKSGVIRPCISESHRSASGTPWLPFCIVPYRLHFASARYTILGSRCD